MAKAPQPHHSFIGDVMDKLDDAMASGRTLTMSRDTANGTYTARLGGLAGMGPSPFVAVADLLRERHQSLALEDLL